MIKINDFNTQHISCEYADSVIKMERHFKMGNRYLSYILNERNFRDDIVLCPPSKLIKVIESFNLRFPDIDYDAEDWRYFRNYMIRQYERVRKGILHLVLNSLNLSVCPYCNRQYIFGTDNNRKVGAQFDHFYSKSKYPYLALSFYNLIPCCPVCNNAKNAEDTFDNKSLLYPFEEEYGYDIFFEIETDEQLCYLGLSNDFNIKIKSKENVEEDLKQKVQNSSKILHIEELYNLHNDYVSKLLRSKYIFTDEYCQSLLDTYPDWFFDMNEVKNQLYFNSLQKEGWGEQILSKLTYDILNSE